MKIADIINFVRAVEPRERDNSYLPETLRKELELCNRYGFPNTVLLQYDALVRNEYIEILRTYGHHTEIGLWFEVVQPLCEDAGLPWRGRFSWDWRNDVGFLIGYTPNERKKLIDTAFSTFKSVFGTFPQSVGSWHIDAFSLQYMKEQYGIVASCNCKDQYGTDGYTIWGGYYTGAYYPSKTNMLCPADCHDNQIDVPVFRMLGSDPIHQYDLGLGDTTRGQSVMSLEPVYSNSGADRHWVEWYLRENFNGKGLSLSYTQFGQENSFGWDKIEKGLSMQFTLLSERVQNGEIELLTLAEAGKKFSDTYKTTPPTALCIDSDCLDTDYKTVWYMSSRYRINTLFDHGKIKIRDLQIFDSNFRERYLDRRTVNNECFFSNIPLTDGFRFSNPSKTAGAYFCFNEREAEFQGEYRSSTKDNKVTVSIGSSLFIHMSENHVRIQCNPSDYRLCFRFVPFAETAYRVLDEKTLEITYFGYIRTFSLQTGTFKTNGEEFDILPEYGEIVFKF